MYKLQHFFEFPLQSFFDLCEEIMMQDMMLKTPKTILIGVGTESQTADLI